MPAESNLLTVIRCAAQPAVQGGADNNVRAPSRSRAIERAVAETKAIAEREAQERLNRELAAISIVRKARIAATEGAIRRKIVTVASLTGIFFAVIGYVAGVQNSSKVQLHVLGREAPILAGNQAVQVARSNGQAIPPVNLTSPVLLSTVGPSVALPVVVQGSTATLVTTTSALPSVASRAVPLPPFAPVVRTVQPMPPVNVVTASRTLQQAPSSLADAKPVENPAEDSEIVLSPRPKPEKDKSQAIAASILRTNTSDDVAVGSSDFKVVNLLEGTVVVRQGQSVRQVKVGEKMPDGQVLKNVNVDKGQFETIPK